MHTRFLISALAYATSLLAQPALASNVTTYACQVVEVARFANRVHVKCGNPYGPWFFAVPTSNSGESAAFASMASAALTLGRPLVLTVDFEDLQGTTYGCLQYDCRRPTSYTVGK